jgi:hypothetical protein
MSESWNVTVPNGEITNAKVSTIAAIDRSKLAQRVLARFPIHATEWRTWDALATNLPGTPAADDLGVTTGTFGSDPGPYVSTGDLKAAGATTRYAACLVAVPHEYEANETLTLRAYAGMVTTVADVSATLDFQAYRIDRDATVGAADVIATAAQSINSLTAAAFDFTVTPTTLVAGDVFLLRMAIAVNDAATATAVIGAVFQVELMADLR